MKIDNDCWRNALFVAVGVFSCALGIHMNVLLGSCSSYVRCTSLYLLVGLLFIIITLFVIKKKKILILELGDEK